MLKEPCVRTVPVPVIPRALLVVCACMVLANLPAFADDWPMWRYDSARGAASPHPLPPELHWQWTRELGARKQAWDDALNLDLMSYDRMFEPVVMGGRLFLGFNDRDKLAAYDLETGAELWSYFAEGPVRLPPVAWKDRVFFASDDGHLYCVKAADGTLLWKFRGGPNSRQILGNQRLISAWPMRGGPVVRDGHVYCAASIWPFMGTFITALDARTGNVVWVNDETGAQYIKQPHGAPSFAGIAPQGALVATENVLLVPGGRSVPAAFDRRTGKLQYFELNAGGKGTGGSFLAANEQSWFVHTRQKGTREFSLKTGIKTAFLPNQPVLVPDRIYSAQFDDKKRDVVRAYNSHGKELVWELPVDGLGDLILAGKTLYAAGKPITKSVGSTCSPVTAIQLPSTDEKPIVSWTVVVPGTVERLVAANGKLIAVTLEGAVHVFGADAQSVGTVLNETAAADPPRAADTNAIVDRLLQAGTAEGYALWLGAGNDALVSALSLRSPFTELTVVDDDTNRVSRLQRQFDSAGRNGRVTARGTPRSELRLPPYVMNMLFVGTEMTGSVLREGDLLNRLFESVRPYGGVMYLLADPGEIPALRAQVQERELEQAEVTATEFGVVIRRVGPLPGAGTWTHKHGDIANTIKSNDQRVKLPLGVLWFGGVSHEDTLPRHGHGPPEQVIGGRLFIQGTNSLTARDVYTGRVLWKRDFQDLGTFEVFYDETYKEAPLDPTYNQVHIPGSNARGTNYVVTADRVYILEGTVCHALDPATGRTLFDITLPQSDPDQPNEWGYIGVYEDVLIGGVGFAKYRSRHNLATELDAGLAPKRLGFGGRSLDRAASMALVGFDRQTGRQLWKIDALHSFWHNGIVAGQGLVYVLDKNPKPVEEFLRRRGQSDPVTYRLLAFDARTGRIAWELPGQVFGTWLGYSEKHDLLLQAGAAASDRLTSEVGQGMAVYRGLTGALIWKKDKLKYSGPCVLHNDLIITNANSYSDSAGAFHLTDGTQKMVTNTLTGELQPWKMTRAYGCNSIVASENLLTFRSGAAGFYDLLTESGTGNFGGFKSGCTSNLVVADGVLNAPDYTRTCSCAYQNQTSLALVHMPEMDAWTNSNTDLLDPSDGRVHRLGVNLGAPGDRRDPHGLMWLEYPPVAGDSPNFGLELTGKTKFFQDHSSTKSGSVLPWVAASGVEGMKGLRLSLKALPRYKLRTGLPVDQIDDDAEESVDGTVDLDSSSLELVQNGKDRQLVAWRFRGVRLARGAEIPSTHLQLTARSPGDDPAELVIRAEASGNSNQFSEKSRDISNRPLTKTEIRWSPDAWKKEAESGPAQRSPDLAPLIREVINREDWQPGNSLTFVVSGQGKRVATASTGRSSLATRLIVDTEDAALPTDMADTPRPYRVRLHFGVPKTTSGLQRCFDVTIAGQTTLENVTLGGQAPTSRIVTIERVLLDDWLDLGFTLKSGDPVLSGIELQRLEE